MKKYLLIFLIFSIDIFAQDSLKNYLLGEIVVTSSKSNLVKSSSVVDVNLETFHSADCTNIGEPLKFLPGIFISRTSKSETKIYMRGYDQRQVTVFLDGVPIYEPYGGLIDLSNLPISFFQKITVSKGMPSLAYGSNSMGGTINFISKERNTNLVSAEISSGVTNSAAAGINGGYKNYYYRINAEYNKSEGFDLPNESRSFANEDGGLRNNSQFENIGGMLKVGANNFLNTDFAYSLIVVNNEKGIPTDVYTSRPRFWKYSEWNKTIHNLMFNHSSSDLFRIKGNLFYENAYNVLNSYDDNTFTTQNMKYAFKSTYDDNSFGLNLLGDLDLLSFGLSRISFSWRNDIHKEEPNSGLGFAKYQASVTTISWEQDINLSNRLSAVVGAGYDLLTPIFANDSPLRENSSSLNAFAGFSYKAGKNLLFHLNGSKKSRFPTLKEFYAETIGRDVANPYLNIEKSFNAEIGFKLGASQNLSFNGNIFFSRIEELIQLTFLADGNRQFQNIGKAEMKGFELSLSAKEGSFSFDAGITYLSAKNLSENARSDILEHRPEYIFTLAPRYNIIFGTSLSAEFLFVGNNYGNNTDARQQVLLEDYLITNLKVDHTLFENYTLFIRLNNVLDTYYESDFGFPQPGREILFGLKFRM